MADDDLSLKNYQDDLDTDKPDEFANEHGSSPAEELGMSEATLKEELEKLDIEDQRGNHEDMRETIEDRDEDDDSPASTA